MMISTRLLYSDVEEFKTIPFVQAVVSSGNCSANRNFMIDSGAGISLIMKNVFNKSVVKTFVQEIKNFLNGKDFVELAEDELEFNFNFEFEREKTFFIDKYLIDTRRMRRYQELFPGQSFGGIIGSDFLSAHNCNINYKTGQLEIHGRNAN